MNQVSLIQLREAADQLILLAGTFQTKILYLRAKQIRQADKALLVLDSLFSSTLALEAKQWKEAAHGYQVLKKKLEAVDEKQKEIENLTIRLENLKASIYTWISLEDQEKQRILQNAKRAHDFINNNLEKNEAHILHRYNRFSLLKELIPYADNANYLCEAIFYYENLDKYTSNIEKVTEKKKSAIVRLKTIKQGFAFAVAFCIFIVSIPICLPLAISLWKRKKEIENLIETSEETLKKEQKRLIAAEEGSVIAQEVRAILGEMSLEQVRDTLAEVRDLRAEFQGPERATSSTAVLLSFIDLHRIRLSELFGEIPDGPIKVFKWLAHNVNKCRNIELEIEKLQDTKKEAILQKKRITKGYSSEILESSIGKLETIMTTTMNFPFDIENIRYFSEICIELPSVLVLVRETLFYISRSHSVDARYWDNLRLKIQGFSNTMSLCVFDAELENLNLQESNGSVIKKSTDLSHAVL